MDFVKIGIIGCGGIARSTHIPMLKDVNECKITAICDINQVALKTVGDDLGIAEENRYTDYRELIDKADVDAVEICTPNYLHVPIAEYAINAGKHVNVEKPLSINMENAKKIEPVIDNSNVHNMMCFSYRFYPAVRYAKHLLKQNKIGDIVSVHVEYLKSSALWPDRRLEWRFVKEYAGTGVLGDLGVHLIDMATLLIGDIKSVCADAGVVVKQRKLLYSEEMGNVETDDYCNFLTKFENGTVGTFVITRCALGNANTIKYDILGTDGVISFNLNNPEILGVCLGKTDGKSEKIEFVDVPEEFHITQERMFVDKILGKECEYYPSVYDGLKAQVILDALLESSEKKSWIEL